MVTSIKLVLLLLVLPGSSSAERLVFVIDKVSQVSTAHVYGGAADARESEHHSAPVVMGEFSKKCSGVAFTKNKESAEFILETQPGGSSVSNQKGEVLYISPAKTLKSMAKDVCGYITTH